MIFVSYSHYDILTTRKLVENLSARGVECWLDETNIPVGQAFVERLGKATREANCFLLVDTSRSRASYWVSRELQTSSRYRQEGRYHSTLRVYLPDEQSSDAMEWDASILLDETAPTHIIKFLARRLANHVPSRLDDRFPSVSILGDTGLGQPQNWMGRQDELHKLDKWWFSSFPGVWIRGLGGIGKAGLIQTWITALSYLGYCKPVTANVLYLGGHQTDFTEAQRALDTWATKGVPAPLLLFVDDHDESRSPLDLERFITRAIDLGARVLASSRASVPHPLSEYFMNLNLSAFTRRDSVAMLEQLGITGAKSDKERLAAELGDHPLALLLLSHSMRNDTAVTVLTKLRAAQKTMAVGEVDVLRSIRGLLTHVVQGLSSEARVLLQTLCRTPEDRSEPLSLAHPKIHELVSVGLVQVDHLETPTKLSIHPLVRRHINEGQSAAFDDK